MAPPSGWNQTLHAGITRWRDGFHAVRKPRAPGSAHGPSGAGAFVRMTRLEHAKHRGGAT